MLQRMMTWAWRVCESAELTSSRRTSPVVLAGTDDDRTRVAPALDQAAAAVRQSAANFLEHLLRDGDLGHLECDVAAVAHHLRADLNQLLLQARERPVLTFGSGVAQEIAEVVVGVVRS